MYKDVLVPIDLQHKSSWERVLPAAVQAARESGARLHVLTVVPDLFAGVDWRYAIRGEQHGSIEYDRTELMTQAKERIQELVAGHVPNEVETEVVVRHGTVYEQILEAADEVGADLIVMASHRPSLKDYLLGPNAARVVRHARCSVQIVRNPPEPGSEAGPSG
ncbi:MAG: universal stress protein [Geminicoccaceae bacterium]|nr:universal stress protein [Geminicoccaceae bacterium]